jgi:hypothetical protein
VTPVRAAAGPAASARPVEAGPENRIPLDVTTETASDGAADVTGRAARRTELMAVTRRLKDQDRQADIDRIHADFDANAAERAEYLRQMNVLRDMAMEQQKHDDEILKKWISLI